MNNDPNYKNKTVVVHLFSLQCTVGAFYVCVYRPPVCCVCVDSRQGIVAGHASPAGCIRERKAVSIG